MPVSVADANVQVWRTNSQPTASVPLRLGTQWVPGNKRVIWVTCPANISFSQWAGWSKIHDQLISGSGRVGVFTKALAAGDGDGALSFSTFCPVVTGEVTVLSGDPTFTIVPASGGSSSSTNTTVAPSVTTGLGILLTFHVVNAADGGGLSNFTIPSGMTHQDHGFDKFTSAGAAGYTAAMFSEPRTSGASGTRTAIAQYNGANLYAGPWRATSVFIRGLTDQVIALGKASTVNTARALTQSFGPTTIALGKATTVNTVRALSNPLMGLWTAPPKVLKEGIPVAGSVVSWDVDTPGLSSIEFETSTDNGASWQPATQGGPVPRLVIGSMVAKTVLGRAILRRSTVIATRPILKRFEVHVSQDGTRDEMLPVGVFNINDTEISDSWDGLTLEISGADRSRRVSRNRWETTYVVYKGANVGDVIRRIINDRLPGTQFNFASTEEIVGTMFFGEDSSNDPMQDALDLALGAGMELYFDPRGICVLRPEPNPDIDLPVWTFEDKTHPTIVSLRRRVTDENTYNRIVVVGEGSAVDYPVRGEWEDLDPASPTYVLGRYGRATQIIRSEVVLTDQQAQSAAQALGLRQKGATEEIELQVVPQFALEQGDIIAAERSRSRVRGHFIIDSMRIPFSWNDTMIINSRRQRLT